MSDARRKYRINAVSEMTGVPAATLRAWERRYGLPDPQRTDSSYRVYDDTDVALIRRVRELCDAGMAPSEAAKAVLEEEASAQEPPMPANTADPWRASVDAIVQAVERFEPGQTESALRHAMALGSASLVFDRVLAPAMKHIGDAWERGDMSVAQEHFASRVLEGAASTMLRLVKRDDAGRKVLLACFADDEHDFPSYGPAIHFATWGFEVIRLGGRTPPSVVRQACEQLEPALVVLTATMLPAPHRARELVEEYGAACRYTPWIVGGSAVTELQALVEKEGGTALLGYEPKELKKVAEGLIVRSKRAKKG